jgi:hypothetical protein
MASDTVLCQGCGITLRPFMQRCPRCGAEREPAAEPQAEPAGPTPSHLIATQPPDFVVAPEPAEPAPPAPPPAPPWPVRPAVIAVDDVRRRALRQETPALPFVPPQDAIFVSPPDEVRRFPLFTRAQIMLMLAGLGLVIFGLLIGYLLWSREQRDASVSLSGPGLARQPLPAVVPPVAAPPLDLNETPAPALSIDDQVLFEEAKKVLAAYNPRGFARYQFTVKDGIVTLNGEADHQPEKDGATNVLRLLSGAKSVVNNLIVKSESGLPTPTPDMLALLATPTPAPALANTEASLTPPGQSAPESARPQPDAALLEAQRLQQLENERLQRELLAARQREADLQRQREADEAARRQQQEDAQRAAVAKPPPPARPARAPAENLRSGTVAWSGVVDGVDEIVISGSSAAVRHVSGGVIRDVRASFSVSVPRAPVSVKLLSQSGRGSIQIVQQPAAANGYTTIVRIDDSANGGGHPHQFTLRWLAE